MVHNIFSDIQLFKEISNNNQDKNFNELWLHFVAFCLVAGRPIFITKDQIERFYDGRDL